MLGRMWRHWNPCALLVGRLSGIATVKNSMVGPKKIKIKVPCDPTVPLLGIYSKELKTGSQRGICATTFIAPLFTIAKRYNNPSVH